jgi:glycine cleavage system regulatory protein
MRRDDKSSIVNQIGELLDAKDVIQAALPTDVDAIEASPDKYFVITINACSL